MSWRTKVCQCLRYQNRRKITIMTIIFQELIATIAYVQVIVRSQGDNLQLQIDERYKELCFFTTRISFVQSVSIIGWTNSFGPYPIDRWYLRRKWLPLCHEPSNITVIKRSSLIALLNRTRTISRKKKKKENHTNDNFIVTDSNFRIS